MCRGVKRSQVLFWSLINTGLFLTKLMCKKFFIISAKYKESKITLKMTNRLKIFMLFQHIYNCQSRIKGSIPNTGFEIKIKYLKTKTHSDFYLVLLVLTFANIPIYYSVINSVHIKLQDGVSAFSIVTELTSRVLQSA